MMVTTIRWWKTPDGLNFGAYAVSTDDNNVTVATCGCQPPEDAEILSEQQFADHLLTKIADGRASFESQQNAGVVDAQNRETARLAGIADLEANGVATSTAELMLGGVIATPDLVPYTVPDGIGPFWTQTYYLSAATVAYIVAQAEA